MSDESVPMTLRGKNELEAEMKKLKAEDRPAVIQAIAEARAHGDLSENAEYSAAKEKQGFIEGRIQEIGDRLARAEVIDPSTINSDQVLFGATVTLLDEDGKEVQYQIVGEPEADLEKKRLSIKAPLARALLKKREGDEVELKTGRGESVYEIIKIEYK